MVVTIHGFQLNKFLYDSFVLTFFLVAVYIIIIFIWWLHVARDTKL
jgi:hypothetical protein